MPSEEIEKTDNPKGPIQNNNNNNESFVVPKIWQNIS